MARIQLLSLCWIASGLLSVAHGAAPPAKNPFAGLCDLRMKMAKPMNGVHLRTNATLTQKDLKVGWSLNYGGKRQPLVILTPTLTLGTHGQTELYVYAIGKDGKAYYVLYASAYNFGFYAPNREWYLTIPKGKQEAGEVAILLASLKEKFVTQYPRQFGKNPPKALACQLVHKPTDRGAGYDLDAWTGDLVGSFTVFYLEQW